MPLSSKSLAPPVSSPGVARLDDVLACMAAHGRPVDPDFLRSVYDFSAEMHKDQVRRSGEPYMVHPLNVAYLLADLKFDQTCVAVGLLHDVLEDTLTTREVLEKEFGDEICGLVDGVTKIGRHEYVRRDEAQAETFRKMILASAKDIRVIVVKLADRLHNMATLEHMPAEARRRISRETLEIYAPIAHRLGMARVKGDLEDLAFFHLYPHQFAELHFKIAEKMKLGQATMDRIRGRLAKSLDGAGIDAEISFRVKRFYSIYEKLRRQGIDISQLYDFLAFRIVTASLKDTYAALGVVHQNWRPIPGRFKDYIAMPKPNLYQSLHTTVVGDQGQPFEVQIRTREMDVIAEEGIAAHWRYKEGRVEARTSDPNIVWLRQLLEWQKEVQDPRTFLTTLKVDLYPDEVYVFTPKGEVFSFPRGATPLDFAYRVHTDLGHHCAGARVNGKLVPLRTALVERRHGGGAHQPDAQSEPRLAEPGHHLARQEQDPAVAQHPAEAARDGDRPAAVRQGDPQVRPLPAQGDGRAGLRRLPHRRRGSPSSTTSTAGSASARPSRATSSSGWWGWRSSSRGRRRSRGGCARRSARSSPSAPPPARSPSRGTATCSPTSPSAATRCRARRSWATSPAAAASRCTGSTARTCRTCSTTRSGRSRSSGSRGRTRSTRCRC